MWTRRDLTTADDRALARQLRRGDHQAFEAFVDTCIPALYRFATSRIGSDPELVDEIVQTTLYQAFTSLRSYRGEGSLAAWITGICRFVISNHRRRQRRRPDVRLMENDDAVLAAAPTGERQRDPEQRLVDAQARRRVHEVLDALPARYAVVLEWKYVDGKSVREIATLCSLSPKAAESLLTRARQAFRTRFTVASSGERAEPSQD